LRCHACWLLEVHAAGDLDALAGYPAVAVAEQCRDRAGDVLGLAVAAERRDGGDDLLELLILAQDAVAEIGRGRSGSDRVDGDAARTDLLREVAAEDLDGTLDGAVDDPLGRVNAGCPAGEVDDRAVVGQERQELLRKEEDALRWTSTRRSKPSSVASTNDAVICIPALLIRKSKVSRSQCSRRELAITAANASNDAVSPVSSCSATAVRPNSEMALTTSFASSACEW
jgi:hypothetical protein